MRILVAPLELKGTLGAKAAAEAVAAGLRAADPRLVVDLLPWADGGPGTLDLLLSAAGGQAQTCVARDPLQRPIQARWGRLPDGAAVVEMAEASGLWRLAPSERDPTLTGTEGTGDLIRAALDSGCREIWVAAGGSATNDGGAGALRSLGARFLDSAGAELAPGGLALKKLAAVDLSRLDARLSGAAVRVLVDVASRLLGPEGASRLFAAQKGADGRAVEALESALGHFAAVLSAQAHTHAHELPGAGAAGGLAYGLMAAAGAQCVPAFDVLAARVGLAERLGRADVLITAEGRLDAQTLLGKGPFRLAREAKLLGKHAVAIVGQEALGAPLAFPPWDEVLVLGGSGDQSAHAVAARLSARAEAWARAIRAHER